MSPGELDEVVHPERDEVDGHRRDGRYPEGAVQGVDAGGEAADGESGGAAGAQQHRPGRGEEGDEARGARYPPGEPLQDGLRVEELREGVKARVDRGREAEQRQCEEHALAPGGPAGPRHAPEQYHACHGGEVEGAYGAGRRGDEADDARGRTGLGQGGASSALQDSEGGAD